MDIYERKQHFLNKARMKHGNFYDYSSVEYVNSHTKILIICPTHGAFFQVPLSHVKGARCPNCAGTGTVHTLDQAISIFREVHGERYNYDFVNYVTQEIPVKIICELHGDFFLSPNKHKNGRGCQKCGLIAGIESMSKNKKGKQSPRRMTFDTFVERAVTTHGMKYDYTKSQETFEHSGSNIVITCPTHGDFVKRASNHLMGRGCEKCKNKLQYSSSANEWLNSLNLPNLIREYRIPENRTIAVDAYDEDSHTIFQFHGDYWHGGPRFDPCEMNKTRHMTFGQLRDESDIRDQHLLSLGYNLQIMWESDWRRIKKAGNN